jgi:hypothetical protein
MGGQQSSSGPTPQQGAQAQAMAQAAGTKFNIATSPVGAYAEALNQIQFNPIFQRVQSATSANSAMQNALANQETMAKTNPYGTAGGLNFAKTAGDRMSQMMGQAYVPGLTPADTSQAFVYPTRDQLPSLSSIQRDSQMIGNAVPNIAFWGGDNNTNSNLMYN